ncbi:MAG: trypsin-like peptidase domain-containing protein [Pirellulales bacterium]
MTSFTPQPLDPPPPTPASGVPSPPPAAAIVAGPVFLEMPGVPDVPVSSQAPAPVDTTPSVAVATPAAATASADVAPPSESPQPPASSSADDEAEPSVRPAANDQTSRSVYRLTWSLTFLGFLLATVSGVPYVVEEVQYRLERGRQRARVEIATAALGDMHLSELSRAYQLVSQRVGPSVVHINIVEMQERREATADGEGADAESLPRRPRRRFDSGQGSGVVVDAEGFIVTNRHVIEDARQIEVVLSDGRRRPARVVGVDEPTDIAVLKVDAPGMIPAEWGDSEDLEVGGLVWAVGSPFGLERSITFGIISAKNRAGVAGTPFQNLMQTDAAVNPGNSGGPLVDVQGRVVGINTAIVGPSYQGVSFAIPSRVAERVYRDLRTRGAVTRGWLGIEPQTVDEEIARQFGLEDHKGALVRRLADGPLGEQSPARAAGLRAGDVIQRWNGHSVDSAGGLIARVSQTQVGETVPVVVLREGAEVQLSVTVGQRPAHLQ